MSYLANLLICKRTEMKVRTQYTNYFIFVIDSKLDLDVIIERWLIGFYVLWFSFEIILNMKYVWCKFFFYVLLVIFYPVFILKKIFRTLIKIYHYVVPFKSYSKKEKVWCGDYDIDENLKRVMFK